MIRKKECNECAKRKTMFCPNSSKCYSLDNLPNFKTKLDLLNDIDTLNKGIDELIEKYEEKLKSLTWIKGITAEATAHNIDSNIKKEFYEQIIQDLKKLKGE